MDTLRIIADVLYPPAMRLAARLTVIAALIGTAFPASALCIYNGVLDAKTTIAQEFRDSRWVVKARVIAAKDSFNDENSWTTYSLGVIHAYKGHLPRHFSFFTYRDSGGFYMDRPSIGSAAIHDIGGEYLLFLDPIGEESIGTAPPASASGAVVVNYSCGQSAPWAGQSRSSRHLLSILERAP